MINLRLLSRHVGFLVLFDMFFGHEGFDSHYHGARGGEKAGMDHWNAMHLFTFLNSEHYSML
jgi:hypothetical protein